MARGSKPGERRGGRKKGTLNKATADIKALAQTYTSEAMDTLANVMRGSDSDAARVAAIKEIFERGHGKSPQALIGGGPDDPAVKVIHEVRFTVVDPQRAGG